MKFHPDRGGDAKVAQSLNVVLNGLDKEPPDSQPAPPAYQSPSTNRSGIYDIRDYKQDMIDIAGEGAEPYTVWAYEKPHFRAATTVAGNEDVATIRAMISGMLKWETYFKPEAIFIATKADNTKKQIRLVYLNGSQIKPIVFEHDSFNDNPGNDEQFERALPSMLSKVAS